jgi:hypothetical protein
MTMKMIKFGVGVIGLLMSTTIFAVDVYNDTTAPLATGTVDPTDCGVLATAAKVNLSTGVIAALHCRSIWGDATVAACHGKGNVAPTSETCGCTNTGTSATPNYVKNITTCAGTCDVLTGAYTQSVEGQVDTVLLAGRKAFGSSTAGGQLLPYSLGDTGLCDNSNLAGIIIFP